MFQSIKHTAHCLYTVYMRPSWIVRLLLPEFAAVIALHGVGIR